MNGKETRTPEAQAYDEAFKRAEIAVLEKAASWTEGQTYYVIIHSYIFHELSREIRKIYWNTSVLSPSRTNEINECRQPIIKRAKDAYLQGLIVRLSLLGYETPVAVRLAGRLITTLTGELTEKIRSQIEKGRADFVISEQPSMATDLSDAAEMDKEQT